MVLQRALPHGRAFESGESQRLKNDGRAGAFRLTSCA